MFSCVYLDVRSHAEVSNGCPFQGLKMHCKWPLDLQDSRHVHSKAPDSFALGIKAQRDSHWVPVPASLGTALPPSTEARLFALLSCFGLCGHFLETPDPLLTPHLLDLSGNSLTAYPQVCLRGDSKTRQVDK